MKITLIFVASPLDPLKKSASFMPLSLPILAGTAPQHEYTFIDMLANDKIDFEKPADIAGLSVRLTAEKEAYRIAAEFRKRGVKVVIGGPQASAVPFRAKKHADAVVIGEGEPLWPVLLEDAEAGKLKDFYVCSPTPFIAEGKSIYQVYNYVDLGQKFNIMRNIFKRKYVFDTVFASRGCNIKCDFCYVPDLFGEKIRTRPVEDVVSEIKEFKNYYYLLDDTIWGRPESYNYYLELYRNISQLGKKRFFTGQGNLDAASTPVGRKVIKESVKAGLIYAAIGIESINSRTLKSSRAIGKAGVTDSEADLEKIKDNIRFIQDCGVIVSGWFVIGYEGDTIDTYYRTLDFCLETNILPAIFPIKALPGTPLYKRLEKEGKLDDSKLINFRNPDIKDEDVLKALKYIREKGYSLSENFKRLKFYLSKFKQDKIHRSIFLMILQAKFGQSIDISKDEFYYD